MSVMFQTLTTEETLSLKSELFLQLPGSAKIYYILCNHLDNLLTGFEVIVDQWPNWNCLILRAKSSESVPTYFKNYYMCHTRSPKDFKYFIQRPCVVDWKSPAIFTGVPSDVVTVFYEKSRKEKGEITNVENRLMYAWTKSEPPEPDVIPEGLQLSFLKRENAEIVCDHWKNYRQNKGLVEYFRQVIENFESSAIVTKEGHLVAYISMQFNGAMANLFVDPEYHNLNLGIILLKDLTRKLLSKNHTAYGFIKAEDTSFITTCQNIGYTWVALGGMSWLHYRPNRMLTNSPFANLSPRSTIAASSGSSSLEKDLFLNALPLSCNKCSGIPAISQASCVHVRLG